jgi:hypothetical protein
MVSSTSVPSLCVAAIIERVPLDNRWARTVARRRGRTKRPAATIKERDDPLCARWRVTGFAIELHRSESEGYFLNISTEQPKAFVMWRSREADGNEGTQDPMKEAELAIIPKRVTVSYNEAGRLLDGGEQVETVPLPAEIRAWMEPFTDYRPEPKRKCGVTSLRARRRARRRDEDQDEHVTTDKPDPPDDAPALSLKRWSQRKDAARRGAERVADTSTSPSTVPSGAAVPEASTVEIARGGVFGAVPLGRGFAATQDGPGTEREPLAQSMTAPAAAPTPRRCRRSTRSRPNPTSRAF